MESDRRNAPLQGLRVLITRERQQAESLATALTQRGAYVVSCPTITYAPPDNWSEVDHALDKLEQYDMLLFTSATGVRFFMQRAQERATPKEMLQACTVIAIGPGTARQAATYGLVAESIPSRHDAEGLLELFKKKDLRSKRILFPRAAAGRDILPQGLRNMGALIDIVVAYRTLMDTQSQSTLISHIEASSVDLLVFTSPSTAHNFVELIGKDRMVRYCKRLPVACIGNVTAAAARDLGFTVAIVPQEHTILSLVEAIVDFFETTPLS